MDTVLPEDVVMDCRGVGVCYRKPYKFLSGQRGKGREFWPFRRLDLEIRRGETLGVVGRNGAGKSTLMRLLAGVTLPDEGRILRRPGLNVQLLSINLGFESILSGRENAIMAGMLLGLKREQIRSRLDAIQDFSGLGDFFDEPVYSYSSGMKARLGFSIAVESEPDVLLLDEVLAVGDQDFREKSREVTKEIIKSGRTVILVMHNMELIRKLSDRVIEL